MENKTEILNLIKEYELEFQGEVSRTEAIKIFLENFEGLELFNRKNFIGHITASAYVLNPTKDALLLLKHKALKIWLQPGGHVDETDNSLYDAALREAEEETGLSKQNLLRVNDLIFEVDSHAIPANDVKNEPPHVHHDISFLFVCNKEEINIDIDELTASKWVSFSELKDDPDYRDIILKINECL
jgi:8-oxo-dGTP pyrophosphatase MutT (NUDIX family)